MTYSPNCVKCRMSRPGDPSTHEDHIRPQHCEMAEHTTREPDGRLVIVGGCVCR